MTDAEAGYVSGGLLQAGSETTYAQLVGFAQAMLIFPHVARAAQAEIDSVCGDRMPSLDDMPNLPYIRSCVKESFRWMPGTPLGVPHSTIEEDEYLGYRIPKDASVLYNVWYGYSVTVRLHGTSCILLTLSSRTLHNDPERYPNPRVFDPTRYAADSLPASKSALHHDVNQRDHFLFGVGRRICQGIHIADRSMFLAISRLLWAFDFRPAVDEKTGRELVPDMNDLQQGLFMMPSRFDADIVPRSAMRSRVIGDEWERIKRVFLGEDKQWTEVPDGIKWKGMDVFSGTDVDDNKPAV